MRGSKSRSHACPDGSVLSARPRLRRGRAFLALLTRRGTLEGGWYVPAPRSELRNPAMNEQDKRDLAYHERCRAVARLLGIQLVGSSIEAGFSGPGGEEVSHRTLLFIEKMVQLMLDLMSFPCPDNERCEGAMWVDEDYEDASKTKRERRWFLTPCDIVKAKIRRMLKTWGRP